jgi:phospholipid N-methyltransferase
MSEHEGHIVAAVFEVHSLPTIVAGVYGNSDSSDRSSLMIVEELRSFLRELSHVYQTQRILLAGDFNVAMEGTDSNSGNTHKPLTAAQLKEIIVDHQLVDVGQKAKNTQHTWYRKDSSGQSSRLDYIFSSVPLRQAKLTSTLSIFDHVYLEAILNPSRQFKQMTMKDFILGSDEFIIQSHELLISLLQPYQTPHLPVSPIHDHAVPPDVLTGTGIIDDNIQIDEKGTGFTSLHLFNEVVQQLQHLHDQIARDKRTSAGKRLRDTSSTIFSLKKELRRPCSALRKQEITEQITHLQHELSPELEAKDVASTLRIKNFYSTNTGRWSRKLFTA